MTEAPESIIFHRATRNASALLSSDFHLTQNGNQHFTLCFQGRGDFHASKNGEPPRGATSNLCKDTVNCLHLRIMHILAYMCLRYARPRNRPLRGLHESNQNRCRAFPLSFQVTTYCGALTRRRSYASEGRFGEAEPEGCASIRARAICNCEGDRPHSFVEPTKWAF